MNMKESNKLIADFMDQDYDTIHEDGCVLYARGSLGQSIISYSQSWSHLMPVVEKIEELGFHVRIFGKSTLILEENGTTIINPPFGYGKENSKIEHTYHAVIEFIKWYNKNK